MSAPRTTSRGDRVEEDVRQVAATLGLADFVYKALPARRGSAHREPGDALLYANGLGAIVQVKSRDLVAGRRENAEELQSWIDKHGTKAHRQGLGTRRQLTRQRTNDDPVTAVPVRASSLAEEQQCAASLCIDMDPTDWPIVVVIDHPRADHALAPDIENVFWITLADWHELHHALRSTTALLTYIYRVIATIPPGRHPLGNEALRFRAIAEADEAAPGGVLTTPWLSYSNLEDPEGAEMYRYVLERVWPDDGSLPAVPLEDYRALMEHLDAVPPHQTSLLGRWVQEKRHSQRRTQSWSGGTWFSEGRLITYACDHIDNYPSGAHRFAARLGTVTSVRAAELAEHGHATKGCAAIGVLCGPDDVQYQFLYTPTPLEVPPEIRLMVEVEMGVLHIDGDKVSTRQLRPRRNDPCPCQSGRKWKRCHGQ